MVQTSNREWKGADGMELRKEPWKKREGTYESN